MFAEDRRMAHRSKSEAGVVARSPVSVGRPSVGGWFQGKAVLRRGVLGATVGRADS
jgi:hypothetical protein